MAKEIRYKTAEEIEIIRRNGDLLGRAHGEVARLIRPGVKTQQLDQVAETFIRDHEAVPSFKGYNGFPASLCISVNENVVHGFPSSYELKDGDIVSIDCGVYKNGFHADCAYTYPIGEVNDEVKRLLSTTKTSLWEGIKAFCPGNRLGDVSFHIQQFVEQSGFSVVRELVGHGVGQHLHEAPEVPNYGKRGRGVKLQEGLVLAIEPMVNMGRRNVVQEKDGWTIRTSDRKPSAHYEHTVAMNQGKADVLTTFAYIEEIFSF